jgi:formate dehydrogenase major subunit
MLAIGSNPAENHPAAFGWITLAIERGAKLISVDPRFTRTSSKAHIYAPMRSGTDIAFIGGMIKYVLDDIEANPGNYNMTYVREYTNASFLVNANFQGADVLDGLFSGYQGVQNETDNAKRNYDKSTWQYQTDASGIPIRDKTLQDPNCVFQLLKRHFVRYDADTVCSITGTPKETFLEICQTYAATGAPGKAGTIMYAMGTTQHTYGTQNIRSYAILQFLLGNIGIAGGGINAMRGESNVQGSTDMCLLAHILPGYLKQPINKDTTLSVHNNRVTPTTNDPLSLNWWKNYPKYMVSLLKAWYGNTDHNTSFNYLPKTTKPYNDYSHIAIFEAMYEGDVKGLMCWGQNPAVGGPNSNMERAAMDKLDWLVAVDLWETETAAFWKRPAANSAEIATEVFLLPAACSYEKEGSVSNSGRWMQWRYKAIDPPVEAKSDLWMVNKIMSRLKELYAAEGGPLSLAIAAIDWNYGDDPDPKVVAKEVNGYDLTTGKLMATFGALKDDGTTSSGNWLYCNSYVEQESLDAFEQAHPEMFPGSEYIGNRAARRYLIDVGNGGYSAADGYKEVGLHSYWSWCWPVNRRIIYNRASVDLDGKPWDSEHPVISREGGKWVGDVPDGGAAPMNQGGYYPFIMKPEGHGRIFGMGRADGPLPEHYEPWESPVTNAMSGTQNDPAFKIWRPEEKGSPSQYPIVATTYRVVEHWQAGQMTRNQPWLVELQPEMFVEISEELAAEKGITNGGKVIVETARGSVSAVAIVTKRFKPFHLNGKTVHQVGMPWHWGYTGLSTGDSANLLTPHVGDANTMIPEYKAFLCNIKKG